MLLVKILHLDLPVCIYAGCSIRYFFAEAALFISCFNFTIVFSGYFLLQNWLKKKKDKKNSIVLKVKEGSHCRCFIALVYVLVLNHYC